MNRKIKRQYWIIAVIVLVAVLYIIPNPKKNFNDLFNGNPAIATSLNKFRAIPLKTIDVHETTWKYLSIGKGDKTILFLHGMSGAYDIWWQQIEALKNDYKIVAVTYPPVSSLKEMGEAIEQILTVEKIDKVFVVGSSLGGYLAQYLVAVYPQLIEKAIFGNTFPPNDFIKKQNATLGYIIKYGPEWLVMKKFRDNIVKTVVPASGNSEVTRAFLLEQNYGLMSRKQLSARFECVIDKFEVVHQDKSNIPLLIIESDNDPVVPVPLIKMMKSTYPQAGRFVFHNAGHFPYLNRPGEYTAVIKNFFSGETK